MYQAGQSCISVQRVFAHRDVAPVLTARVVEAVRKLVTGDPTDDATDVGPQNPYGGVKDPGVGRDAPHPLAPGGPGHGQATARGHR
jgi:hypothetical protein